MWNRHTIKIVYLFGRKNVGDDECLVHAAVVGANRGGRSIGRATSDVQRARRASDEATAPKGAALWHSIDVKTHGTSVKSSHAEVPTIIRRVACTAHTNAVRAGRTK